MSWLKGSELLVGAFVGDTIFPNTSEMIATFFFIFGVGGSEFTNLN